MPGLFKQYTIDTFQPKDTRINTAPDLPLKPYFDQYNKAGWYLRKFIILLL